MGLWHTNGLPNLSQKTGPYNSQQKKENLQNCGFAVLADHRIRLKEWEKKYKYLDLSREFEKSMEHEGDNYTNCDWYFWYQKIIKGLENLKVGGRVETIQTTALLRTARILRRVLETWGDLLSLKTPVKEHQLTLSWTFQGNLKKLWNMKVTIIPIVLGTFGTKRLLKDWRIWRLEDEWRPSKLQHYWERPEYWEESWRLVKDHQLTLSWKTFKE